ncbi:MAG TPA: multidrug effflux MFS transporter [Vicinamibacterales bacterium]|nr:multidrug effflux MFS transporter [Vicinamibacterales bacterium]
MTDGPAARDGAAGGKSTGEKRAGTAEFVALMAMLTALVALSIDMVLPALPAIGASLGVARANDNQLVLSLLFLGFGVGQLFYGPFSDAAGRKPAAFLGLTVFTAGCSLALLSQTFPMMLAGRLLQGIGVAGPRTITIALVRDRFEGREMARVMSLVTAVFILVPIIAPALGQAVLGAFGWRAVFVVYLVMGLVTSVWFGLRQEETLPASRRLPFSLPRLASAARQAVTNRMTICYTIAAGLVFGAFLGYLTSAQQILQEQYALGTRFPLYFAILAVAIGGASLANARLVMRYGMRALSHCSLWGIFGVSVIFSGVTALWSGHPPLVLLMAYLMASFFGIGLLFGNLTALAMQPLGAIAGTGSAVVGATSMLISLTLGTVIGQIYDGTVLPLVIGFAVLSLCALVVARKAEAGGEADAETATLVL